MNATVTAPGISLMPINGSDQATPQNNMMGSLIPIFLVTIIAPVGLAGNAIVLWLLGLCMQRTAVSVYILNLAGADFLFLCCHFIYCLGTLTYYLHSVSISFRSFFIIVLFFAYIAGLSFLSAISIERCLSVLWPIWYRCHRPRHTSAVLCVLLWALSLLLSVLEGKYCGFLFSGVHQVWCQVLDLITAGWLIFLCVLLSGSSLALVTRLLCGSQRVQPNRLYVTVLLTVLFFLLCGLPSGIYWFLRSWINHHLDVVYDPLFIVAVVLSCVNSCANPIIYFLVGSFRQRWRKGRQNLKLVLQRALQDTPEGDEHGGRPPQETLEMSGQILAS